MPSIAETVYQKYPRLQTLRAWADDGLVERTIGAWCEDYERCYAEAATVIPTVRMGDVFGPEMERQGVRLENFLGHWGNVSVEEAAKIALIARWLRPRRVLEIGTYNGMTTLQIALNCDSEAIVYTLDLPEGLTPQLPLNELDSHVASRLRRRFGTSTGSYFHDRTDVRIRQLFGDSATFDYAAAIEGPLDLIFIDAAHDLENKRIDTENAFRLLAPGGVILWHNYADVATPEVTRYLAQLAIAGTPIVHLRGTLLALYRAPETRP